MVGWCALSEVLLSTGCIVRCACRSQRDHGAETGLPPNSACSAPGSGPTHSDTRGAAHSLNAAQGVHIVVWALWTRERAAESMLNGCGSQCTCRPMSSALQEISLGDISSTPSRCKMALFLTFLCFLLWSTSKTHSAGVGMCLLLKSASKGLEMSLGPGSVSLICGNVSPSAKTSSETC